MQGKVLHNNDTTVKILELMAPGGRQDALSSPAGDVSAAEKQTGFYISGVVTLHEGCHVALFFSCCRDAGENLVQVLKHRSEMLPLPI